MRGILIDPFNQTVSEVEIAAGLAPIYDALGCRTFDIVRLGEGIDLYIDDEGALIDGQRCFSIATWRQPITIAGRGLILSHDDEGNSIGTRCDLNAITWDVQWLPEDHDYTPAPPVVIGFSDPRMMQFFV